MLLPTGLARSFGSHTGVTALVFGQTIKPVAGEQFWAEYGARLGYRLSKDFVIDAFANGTLGAKPVGNSVHGGAGVRVNF